MNTTPRCGARLWWCKGSRIITFTVTDVHSLWLRPFVGGETDRSKRVRGVPIEEVFYTPDEAIQFAIDATNKAILWEKNRHEHVVARLQRRIDRLNELAKKWNP